MKWILLTSFIGAILAASGPAMYIGKFQLLKKADDQFDDWLQCTGFKREVQQILENPYTIFEISQFRDSTGALINQLTIIDGGNGTKHTEKFSFGQEIETEYFESGKVITKWKENNQTSLQRTLQLDKKQSQIYYEFSTMSCTVRYECGNINSIRIYERI